MKVGDKFVIEIAETFGQDSYKIKGLNSVYSKDTMDKLEPFDETTAFTNGLVAMWEIAKRLGSLVEDGGMPTDDIEELFGCELVEVYVKYSAQEVIKKLAEYKAEINVGDEVRSKVTGCIGTVMKPNVGGDPDYMYLLYDDGSMGKYLKSEYRKTGRHFHYAEKLLNEMKGGED